MEYITVLDFEAGRVFQYKTSNYNSNDYEQILTDSGHNLANCEWMIHKNSIIVDQTGDLPF